MNAAAFSGTLTIILFIVIAVAVVGLGVAVWRYVHSKKRK